MYFDYLIRKVAGPWWIAKVQVVQLFSLLFMGMNKGTEFPTRLRVRQVKFQIGCSESSLSV